MNNPCRRCGSQEKYGNGGCKPCQKKSRKKKYKKNLSAEEKTKNIQLHENRTRRESSRKKGLKVYTSVLMCKKCHKNTRYVVNNCCVTCTNPAKNEGMCIVEYHLRTGFSNLPFNGGWLRSNLSSID